MELKPAQELVSAWTLMGGWETSFGQTPERAAKFIKKTNRESGPALAGIELKNASDYTSLMVRMEEYKFEVKN